MSTKEHRSEAAEKLKIGIVTISTTRTLETDKSGAWMAERVAKEKHTLVCHKLVTDDEGEIRKSIRDAVRDYTPDVLILTGGTGIGPKDVTIEAITPMFRKELSAFGPIFAQLSFEQVDSAAILSRATAGIVGNTALFSLPGSLEACKLACKAIIFPEIGHLVKHIRD